MSVNRSSARSDFPVHVRATRLGILPWAAPQHRPKLGAVRADRHDLRRRRSDHFALPDLRGRVAVSSGQGPGLSTYELGVTGGAESVSLTESEMPAHDHQVSVNGATSGSNKPNNRFLGRVSEGTAYAGASNGKT